MFSNDVLSRKLLRDISPDHARAHVSGPRGTRRCNLVPLDVRQPTIIVLGGFWNRPSWDEYLEQHPRALRPYLRGVRKCIERMQLVGVVASEVCNSYDFKATDGKHIAFTWRAWGDLMQAIVGKNEGYMEYYG